MPVILSVQGVDWFSIGEVAHTVKTGRIYYLLLGKSGSIVHVVVVIQVFPFEGIGIVILIFLFLSILM